VSHWGEASHWHDAGQIPVIVTVIAVDKRAGRCRDRILEWLGASTEPESHNGLVALETSLGR
jgi:hypothetical protein